MPDQQPPAPRWWHKPGLMARTLPLVILGIFVLLGAITAWHLDLWWEPQPELRGSVAHLHWEDSHGLVVTIDHKVFMVPAAGEQLGEPVLLHRDSEDRVPPAWPPHLHCDGENQTLYLFHHDLHDGEDTGRIAIRQVSGALWEGRVTDTRLFIGGRAIGVLPEALDRGTPLQPLIFTQQHLDVLVDGCPRRLQITAEPTEDGQHQFALTPGGEADAAPDGTVLAPGFRRLMIADGATLWVPVHFPPDQSDLLREIAAGSLQSHMDTVHLREPPSCHLVLDPAGADTPAAIDAHFPQVHHLKGPEDMHPLSSTDLARETASAAHTAFLAGRGATPASHPPQLRHGLPNYLACEHLYSGLGDAARAELHALYLLDPTLSARIGLPEQSGRNAAYLGQHMTAYLASSFGSDRLLQYAGKERPRAYRAAWEGEDALTREFFGHTQQEILQAAVTLPPQAAERYPARREITQAAPLEDVQRGVSHFSPDESGERVVAAEAMAQAQQLLILGGETEYPDTVVPGDGDLQDIRDPEWLPGGQRVVFSAKTDRGRELVAVSVDDPDNLDILVPAPAAENPTQPAPSPCGEMIAFTARVGGAAQVKLTHLSSGETTALTEEPVGAGWPRWCPEGERLAYISWTEMPGEPDQLAVLRPETKEVQYRDLSPFRIHPRSRPQWSDRDELLVPVRILQSRTVLQLNLQNDGAVLWGGAEWAAEEIIPLPEPERYLLSVRSPTGPGGEESDLERHLYIVTLTPAR